MMVDLLITNARVMTCDSPSRSKLPLIDQGAVVVLGGKVAWVGAEAELDQGWAAAAKEKVNAQGRLLTPGLVDCHAHPMFAGDRSGEFAMRARGATYHDLALTGGGITVTVEATRKATTPQLLESTFKRTNRALRAGTTTLEAKSGYDLSLGGELRLLEVAKACGRAPLPLVPTLLAHSVPPEARESQSDRANYVRQFSEELIPQAARTGLATSVDIYCDEGAFSLEESRTILTAAKANGLAVRGHVGQFADLGGAQLLAELGALSADHLENVSGDGIFALAGSGTVAVMLPGACIQLRMTPPPVPLLRAAGVPLAIGTDLNPGTSYCETLPVQMWLATTYYAMTVEEAWLGVTRNAARALGRSDIGVIKSDCRADLVLWDTDQPAEIPYHYGANLAQSIWINGRRAV